MKKALFLFLCLALACVLLASATFASSSEDMPADALGTETENPGENDGGTNLPCDLTLSALAVSSGTLSPVFAPGTTVYTLTVASDVVSLNVTPTLNTGLGVTSLTVNGTPATSGSAAAIPLRYGPNTIAIVVAAGASETNTYTLTATRTPFHFLHIDTQPAPITTVTEGSVGGSLSAAASVTGSKTPSYTWYECDSAGVIRGASLSETAVFTLPTALTAGEYHYLCQVTADGAAPVNSNVAAVTVLAPPAPVTIWGVGLSAETPYYHNGADGAQGSADNVPTGANASYDAANGTLTLNGLNVLVPADEASSLGLAANGDLDLVLTGSSTLTVNASADDRGAIRVDGGALAIRGSGSLYAACASDRAIYAADGSLTIVSGSLVCSSVSAPALEGAAGVDIQGGTLVARSSQSHGVTCGSDGGIDISGGHVIAVSEASSAGFGKAVKVSADYLSRSAADGNYLSSPADTGYVTRSEGYCEIRFPSNYSMDFSQSAAVSWGSEVIGVDFSTTDAIGTGWRWEFNEKKLTLCGLDFITTHAVALMLPAGAVIELENSRNTVQSISHTGSYSYGLLCCGPLTVRGSGSFAATGGYGAAYSIGLYAGGNLTFEGSVVVSGVVSGVGSIFQTSCSYGIDTISGTLTVKDNAVVTGTGGVATFQSAGVNVVSITVSDNGSLSGVGGSVSARSGDASSVESCGILAYGSASVSGGSLTGTGGTASTDGDQSVTAESYGVCLPNGSMTVSGGTVSATGVSAAAGGGTVVSSGLRACSVNLFGGVTSACGNQAAIQTDGGANAVSPAYSYGYLWKQNTAATEPSAYEAGAYTPSADYKYLRFSPAPVEAPTFAPAGGSYEGTQRVTIRCAAEGALIRYTTDGTEPTEASAAYTDPFDVSVTTTVKAKAFLAGIPDSGVSTATYVIPASAVYNADRSVWLAGNSLLPDDLLITDCLPAGSVYDGLLISAKGREVFGAYNIYLRSGRTSTGSPMYLHFCVGAEYAGQAFSLLHQKSDGSRETFYASVDANGELSFGSLYELSPFMLLRDNANKIPATGDNSRPLLWAGLAIVAGAALVAGIVWQRRRRGR